MGAELVKPELIESIKVYHFEPGDTLVFHTEQRIWPDAADRIRAMAERQFPGIKAIVLCDGLKLDVIRGLPPEVKE